jgi:hypothetical protein
MFSTNYFLRGSTGIKINKNKEQFVKFLGAAKPSFSKNKNKNYFDKIC